MNFPRYILQTFYCLYQKNKPLVQYWLAGSKNEKLSLCNFSILSFSNLLYLIPRLIICLHFLFLLTGSLNLALKLVMRHDELENVKHGVLGDALVDV